MTVGAIVYKIALVSEWSAARAAGRYDGSADDRRDGFIHFSTAAQVAGTLERHFSGQPDLVIAAVDATRLGAALVLEPSRRGELFPHLYGPLDMAAVVWEKPIVLGRNGRHVLPEEVA
jgi:uncharacterized protein (DUF952 family)